MTSGWEWFLDAPLTHHDALGEKGLAAYRARLQPEWDRVSVLAPGERRWSRDEPYDRFRISHLRASLARADGDIDELVEVMSRDLSFPYHFVEIATELDGAGREREAVSWLERGIRAFPPDGDDERLRRALVDAYLRDGQTDDALAIVVPVFDRKPGPASYAELRHAAGALPDWSARRSSALDLLRERGGGEGRGALVRVLVDEGHVEQAWCEATDGGCSESLWRELAELRRASHPADVLPIYRRLLAGALSYADVRNYKEAVGLLERIEEAETALGHPEAFHDYLDVLRVDQKRRPKLIGMLDKRWPPAAGASGEEGGAPRSGR